MDVKLFLGIAAVRQSGDFGSAIGFVVVVVAHLIPLRSVFVTVIFGICITVLDVICSFAGDCEWAAIALQVNSSLSSLFYKQNMNCNKLAAGSTTRTISRLKPKRTAFDLKLRRIDNDHRSDRVEKRSDAHQRRLCRRRRAV